MAKDVMNKVRLGRTDLMVTPICFGTGGLGDMPDSYGYSAGAERAKATVRPFWTGRSISSTRRATTASAAARRGSAPFCASAAACPRASSCRPSSTAISMTNAFDAARARRSLEQSLKALGLERIDLLHLHDPEHARSFSEATARDGASASSSASRRRDWRKPWVWRPVA